jgi:hypothetical protein
VYMALAVTVKSRLSTEDIVIIACSAASVACGFLLNFNAMPQQLG